LNGVRIAEDGMSVQKYTMLHSQPISTHNERFILLLCTMSLWPHPFYYSVELSDFHPLWYGILTNSIHSESKQSSLSVEVLSKNASYSRPSSTPIEFNSFDQWTRDSEQFFRSDNRRDAFYCVSRRGTLFITSKRLFCDKIRWIRCPVHSTCLRNGSIVACKEEIIYKTRAFWI